jgi:cytidylate kinase
VTVEELDEAEALNFVRTAIHEVYKEGNAIIVGRGGQAVLQKLPGVLHVRVEAPMKDRLLRIQRDTKLKLEDAHSLAVKRDRKTADYLREVFDIDWHDPLLYHLVINSGKLSVDEAAHVIVAAIGQLHENPEPELVN